MDSGKGRITVFSCVSTVNPNRLYTHGHTDSPGQSQRIIKPIDMNTREFCKGWGRGMRVVDRGGRQKGEGGLWESLSCSLYICETKNKFHYLKNIETGMGLWLQRPKGGVLDERVWSSSHWETWAITRLPHPCHHSLGQRSHSTQSGAANAAGAYAPFPVAGRGESWAKTLPAGWTHNGCAQGASRAAGTKDRVVCSSLKLT